MARELEDPRPELEEDDEGGPVKTFLEHLEDLRWVIIKCVSALVLGMVICLAAAPVLMSILQYPLVEAFGSSGDGTGQQGAGLTSEGGGEGAGQSGGSDASIRITFLGPLGGVISSMKVALYGGLCLALPFLIYFIADYILPALKRTEKKFFLRAFIVGGGLFLSGVALCYFWILEISLRGMAAYNKWLGLPADVWRAEEYFQFVTLFMMLMGLCFELPIVLLSLVKLGIIDHSNLRSSRPYFILGIFGVIAFITPDFISTFFLAIPVIILLEACIWIAWYWDRQEKRATETAAAKGSNQTD
jgi:sec-independent protein translocase protein TatC